MDILVQGNKAKADAIRKEEKVFMCHLCGCRWRADKDEYVRNWDFREANYILASICPCCNEVSRVTEPA